MTEARCAIDAFTRLPGYQWYLAFRANPSKKMKKSPLCGTVTEIRRA